MSRLSVASADKVNSTTEQLMKEFTQRIVANPPGVCPVDMQLAFLKVCHAQTCGKCVPCRVGLGQLERLLEKVLDNEATMETLELIEETAENIKNSADCAIGFESARMVLAGLEGFREDYISHITDHRCLGSFEQPIPCVTLCPAHVDIPGYIALAGEGRCEDAVRLIRKDNPFPTACALICEHPCEARCRRNIIDDSINIRGMKRYIVDNAPSDKVPVPACAPSTGKKVAIIGGGPSGLTSAYFLQLMGHQCTVFEEKKQLGGMLRYGIPNYRFPRERLQEDINAILSTGVDVKLNTEADCEELNKFDHVILAIGAHNMDLPMSVTDSNVVSAWDVLAGCEVSGACAVLGGGLVGTETAEFLAQKGLKVSIVEMLDQIATGESETVMPLIKKDFEEHDVKEYVNTRVNSIENNVIHAVNTKDESEVTIEADTIVNALGSKKNLFDDSKLTVPFVYVGDCSGERTADISAAIRSGYQAGNEI